MVAITVDVLSDWQTRLTATASTGTVTWTRSTVGVEVVLGTGAVRIDYTPPLNLPVSYWATDDTDVSNIVTVELAAEKCVLTSTFHGTTVPVTVLRQLPYTFEARSVAHPILNDPAPLVSVAPMVFPEFPLELWVNDQGQAQELRALIRAGDPLVLRALPASQLDTVTFIAVDVVEEHANADRPNGPRIMRINAQAVTSLPTAYPTPPAWAYTDVALVGDYATVEATYGTYDNVKSGTPA